MEFEPILALFLKVLSRYLEARILIRTSRMQNPHQSDKEDPDPDQCDADPKPFYTILSFLVLSCLAYVSVGIDARYKVFFI